MQTGDRLTDKILDPNNMILQTPKLSKTYLIQNRFNLLILRIHKKLQRIDNIKLSVLYQFVLNLIVYYYIFTLPIQYEK